MQHHSVHQKHQQILCNIQHAGQLMFSKSDSTVSTMHPVYNTGISNVKKINKNKRRLVTDRQKFWRPTTWESGRGCLTRCDWDHWGTWLPAPCHCDQSTCAVLQHHNSISITITVKSKVPTKSRQQANQEYFCPDADTQRWTQAYTTPSHTDRWRRWKNNAAAADKLGNQGITRKMCSRIDMQTRLINHANPSQYYDLLNKGSVQA